MAHLHHTDVKLLPCRLRRAKIETPNDSTTDTDANRGSLAIPSVVQRNVLQEMNTDLGHTAGRDVLKSQKRKGKGRKGTAENERVPKAETLPPKAKRIDGIAPGRASQRIRAEQKKRDEQKQRELKAASNSDMKPQVKKQRR